MRGNPDGSPHRRALRARLLSLRYMDGFSLKDWRLAVLGVIKDKVMAGETPANPAAPASSALQRSVLSSYKSLVGSELIFSVAPRTRRPLVLAVAPRETFETAGTGRKAGTSSQEAIRRGHLFSRLHQRCRVGRGSPGHYFVSFNSHAWRGEIFSIKANRYTGG